MDMQVKDARVGKLMKPKKPEKSLVVGLDVGTSKIVAIVGESQPDGSVEVEAQGDRQSLDSFVEELRGGPPLSNVRNVSVSRLPSVDEELDFEIKF